MENRVIEDLTLLQLILLFVKRPARTWKAWKSYLEDRALLFVFNPEIEEIAPTPRTWILQGRALAVTAYDGKAYNLYRVPALGDASLSEFLNKFG